jgi:UDP-N-acetylglucosamine--N-acetylmuramyl-(pentapeptide) pyrophosphoryl-undecaprenol N-acetylglucosamine transferase
MNSEKTVLIMAGGTGGHIFPALAVAQNLKNSGLNIEWLGTTRGLEKKLIPESGYRLHTLSVQGLKGKGLLSWLKAPIQLVKALVEAVLLLRRLKPDLVLGMGGFAAGPGGLAAKLLGIPLVIHEQNAFAGLTNRLLFPLAEKVLCAFPNAFKKTSLDKISVIGNPVREAILSVPAPEIRYHPALKQRKILVLGGSQGAMSLNNAVPLALKQIQNLFPDLALSIWHQSGPANFESTQALYETLELPAKVNFFIEDMAEAYAFADLVICRSGALTIAEIAAVGVPAILIPFLAAADDHQSVNAAYLSQKGAAITIKQDPRNSEVLVNNLVTELSSLLPVTLKLNAMAQLSYSLAKPEATQSVAAICMELCHASHL